MKFFSDQIGFVSIKWLDMGILASNFDRVYRLITHEIICFGVLYDFRKFYNIRCTELSRIVLYDLIEIYEIDVKIHKIWSNPIEFHLISYKNNFFSGIICLSCFLFHDFEDCWRKNIWKFRNFVEFRNSKIQQFEKFENSEI